MLFVLKNTTKRKNTHTSFPNEKFAVFISTPNLKATYSIDDISESIGELSLRS